MRNWRTNLGGAISVLGSALCGIGVLSQLSQISPATATVLTPHQLAIMWDVALAGFIIGCVGKGVTALFAADAASVKSLQSQLIQVPNAIESGNTEMLKKVVTDQTPKDQTPKT